MSATVANLETLTRFDIEIASLMVERKHRKIHPT